MSSYKPLRWEGICDTIPGPRVVGIGGSPRKGGNSDVLLTHVIKGIAQRDLDTTAIHLRDYRYRSCIGCERCRKDKICTGQRDEMSLLYPALYMAKGLVLVSPTHHYNVTAWMKAFIDRLYCFYDFENSVPRGWSSRLAGQGRKAVLVAVCEQENKKDMGFTLEAMRLPLTALGYEIVGELPVYRVFAKGKVKEDPAILSQAVRLGSDLAASLLA